MNKILVAIDHSDRNQFVFNSALTLAKTTGATLMLLQVLSEKEAGYPVLPTYAYYPIVDDRKYDVYQERLAQYKQQGLDLLRELSEIATAAGVKVEYTQGTGDPGQRICEIASSWSADLIMVGSRGLKGLKEMFLGSVSNYVTHHAPCSVLIVRSAIEDDKSNSAEEQPLSTNQ